MKYPEEKQRLLSKISVQCSVAQNGIAKYFDEPDGKELIFVLSVLRELLNSFIDGQAET